MNPLTIQPPIAVAGGMDFEPFNGCKEMLPTRESVDASRPHGPSHAILTARSGKDTVWTSTIKIAILNDPV